MKGFSTPPNHDDLGCGCRLALALAVLLWLVGWAVALLVLR